MKEDKVREVQHLLVRVRRATDLKLIALTPQVWRELLRLPRSLRDQNMPLRPWSSARNKKTPSNRNKW